MSHFPSRREPPVWLLGGGLALLLLAALLFNNARYLFRTDLYEFGDLVVNSLQIIKAKHFQEIYGQYSRWGFHHPGPAFFYVQGWGEWLFHDLLHLVPRPLNAQMLATLVLNCLFAGTALATAARHVGTRTVFLPLALGLGILHVAAFPFYGFKLGALMLMGNWPGYILVVPFAAMLLVFASVAAGRGESLPLAVLIGCFLAHGHIAQAGLFVPPVALAAYLGLLLSCRVRGTLPWREFPRAHWLAAVLIGLFLLPMVLDLLRGGESNFARILAFRHEHVGEEHKPLSASVMFFLQFGAYQWFRPVYDFVGPYSSGELWKYFKSVRVICEFWLLGLLATGWIMASWRRRRADAAAGEASLPEGAADRRRYTLCLAILTVISVATTLVWGCIMNGEMLYYNAFLNFSIFYAGMLVVAAAFADHLGTILPAQWPGRGVQTFLCVAAALLAFLNADRFQMPAYATEPGFRVIADNVASALRDEPASPRHRFLSFDEKSWTLAVDVALLLERKGYPYLASKEWEIPFGEDRCPAEPVDPAKLAGAPLPFGIWRVVQSQTVPAGVPTKPLVDVYVLLNGLSDLDPATPGTEIRFGGSGSNDVQYIVQGWGEHEPSQVPLRWNEGQTAVLSFRAKPVPAGSTVHLTFDCAPVLIPGKRAEQRLGLDLNGTHLGTWPRSGDEPFEVIVPAAVWNAREEAWMRLRFPDAATPLSLGLNGDTRVLAFAFKSLKFRVESPAAEAVP